MLRVVASFVLIPGAGSDPRVYDATIRELRRLGYDGLAPPLPLEDLDAHPSDHAAAVVSATPERSDVIVVAHSLGAFAGSLAAEQVGAGLLVLLAPMIPAPGETAGEWWHNTGHAKAVADLLERHGPMSDWGKEAFDEVFLHDVDHDVARAAERFDGAPGAGMFTEPWPHESWPDTPRASFARSRIDSSRGTSRSESPATAWASKSTGSPADTCRCSRARPSWRSAWSNFGPSNPLSARRCAG